MGRVNYTGRALPKDENGKLHGLCETYIDGIQTHSGVYRHGRRIGLHNTLRLRCGEFITIKVYYII